MAEPKVTIRRFNGLTWGQINSGTDNISKIDSFINDNAADERG